MNLVSRRKFLLMSAGTVGLAALGSRAWAKLAGLKRVERRAHAFGTKVSITALHEREETAAAAIEAALHELELVEQVMSLYRPQSHIRELNRTGRLDEPHPCLVEVLRHAQRISEQSGGAFDVTVQPLWELYAAGGRVGGWADGRIPSAGDVERARRKVDWQKLDVGPKRITLAEPGMAVTLNGIAQGYAADRALAALRAHGVEHALVDTGEIGTLGRKSGREPWTVGIQHPRRLDAYVQLAKLDGGFLATSGDYETTFTPDYVHHHIFDPKTGRSPETLCSVTVLARTGTEADGLATALFVLGVERGFKLLRRFAGAEAMAVRKDGAVLATRGFPRNA
ncbi:MAG: FAD:protein FMN transferase [Planctomycetes bacterium]|nr:FAD:protein FMN transferase [Planctomycetota bacterium]